MLHRQTRQTGRSPSIVIGSVALGILAMLVWWRFFSPPDFAAVSRAGSEAAFGSTSDRVANYLHPEEMKALGMTPDRARTIINEVLKPRMKDFGVVSPKGEPVRQGSRVSIHFMAQCPSGKFESGMEVVETPDGPKTFLSLVALQALRGIQKNGELGHDKSWTQSWNALADDLTVHGLRGYYDLQSGKVYDWPKM